ncbi:MAG TPA: hypothetical protein VJH95_01495 [Candidatus Nanoarchaeia archaeon]|nr:hypothetical protein [Candidatus Nanoarchaeia archaeon]
MKILRLFSKRVGRTAYYKYTVNLPIKLAESSRLLNKPLKAEVKQGKIIIEEE